MNTKSKIEKLVNDFDPYHGEGARYLVMDDETYFEFKIEVYGSVEAALVTEIEDFAGLKVFHNNIGYTFIDVA
jgi:hypothetical protein